jgi:dihydrofolate reductase
MRTISRPIRFLVLLHECCVHFWTCGCSMTLVVRRMWLRAKPAEGDIAIGGAALAAEAAALGLIDEYRARVYPVLVGGGIPFFPQRECRVDPELAETRTFSSRVAYLRYRVAR